jgi:hypothetical protein
MLCDTDLYIYEKCQTTEITKHIEKKTTYQEDYNGKGAKQSRWNPLQHHIVCTPA